MQVTIRPFRASDASNLQRSVLRSVGHVRPWLDWCTPRYVLSDAKSWIQQSESLWRQGQAFRWAIVAHKESPGGNEDILGCVEIKLPVPGSEVAEMGYWVARDAIGQGACTQAAVQALQWAFAHLTLERVELLIQPANYASVGVAEKVGASFQELREGAVTYQGEPRTAACYAVTLEALAQPPLSKSRRSWPLQVAYTAARS